MTKAFPRPKEPMGEAWFMGSERTMFPQLLGDLDELPDDDIGFALEEIASGSSNFGPMREWIEWYHFLLPRLITREWESTFYQPAKRLFTAFMVQYPEVECQLPYPEFQNDALETLGQYIMSPKFWPGGKLDFENCLSKWAGPTGIMGWFDAGNLLSASLFFCIKYLPAANIEEWFRSAITIPNAHWQLQIATWLVGAYPILAGEIQQPSEFPEQGFCGVDWDWSHTLNGFYTGEEPQTQPVPFLPADNCHTILQIARSIEIEKFLEDALTDPAMGVMVMEATGMPERFRQLYQSGV